MKSVFDYLSNSLLRRGLWVGFALVFYTSGLEFTIWIFDTAAYEGSRLGWALILVFPFLVPAFFYVNRRVGCASGACRSGSCEIPPPGSESQADRPERIEVMRMPGA